MLTPLATRIPPCPIPSVGPSAFACPACRRGASHRCLPSACMEMRGSGPYRTCALTGTSIAPWFSRSRLDGRSPSHRPRPFPRLRRRPPPPSSGGSRTPEELLLHRHCRRRPSAGRQREPCSAPSSSRRPVPSASSGSPARPRPASASSSASCPANAPRRRRTHHPRVHGRTRPNRRAPTLQAAAAPRNPQALGRADHLRPVHPLL